MKKKTPVQQTDTTYMAGIIRMGLTAVQHTCRLYIIVTCARQLHVSAGSSKLYFKGAQQLPMKYDEF
jgi:hypothetical protein